MKVLDTDTCIGLLRGRPEIISRREAVASEEVVTTWVTAGELFFGASKSIDPEGNARRVVQFLDTLRILGPDLGSARFFGEVKAKLRAEGNMLADADLMIASIALANDATVVTGNRRHFERVPALLLEDWLRPGQKDSA